MGNFHSDILTAVFQAQCWSTLDCVGLGLPALCRAVLGSLEETRRKEAWFLTSVHLQAPLGDRACNEMIISRQKWLVAPHPGNILIHLFTVCSANRFSVLLDSVLIISFYILHSIF